jgi:hypothetical protein
MTRVFKRCLESVCAPGKPIVEFNNEVLMDRLQRRTGDTDAADEQVANVISESRRQ